MKKINMTNITNSAIQDPINIQIDLLKKRLNELHGGFDDHVSAIIIEKGNELLQAALDRIAFDEHEYQLLIKAVNRTYIDDRGEYIHPLTGEPYDPSDKEMQSFIYRWWHGAYDKDQKIIDDNIINPLTGEIN